MLVDPNQIWLGAEAVSDSATITYADASLTPHDDTENVDPSTFSEHWSWTADFTGGSLTLRDEDQSTDLLEFEHGSGITVHDDLTVSGTLSSVTIDDETLRLSAFNNGATNVSVRATDSDVDEIFEFDKSGQSDYNMFLHRGGSRAEVMTDSHDILREGDNPYAAVADSGTVTLSGPSELNFGTDLGVTDDGDNTVTIDYTGGDIPASVDDDGTEVLSNADGLDFQNHLDVADRGDNYATIDVNTSNLAELDVSETIAVAWTFDAGLAANATTSIHAASDHLEFHESDTSPDDHWTAEINSGRFILSFFDNSAGTTTTGLEVTAGQDINFPNGTVSIQSETSATQPWVTNELAPYADTTSTETISADWSHDANVILNADNQIQLGGGNWEMWHSTSNGNLYLDEASGTAQTIAQFTASGTDFKQSLSVDGNEVATQNALDSHSTDTSNPHSVGLEQARSVDNTFGGDITVNGTVTISGSPSATQSWVDSNYSNYSDSDAISAINNDTDHGSTASHNYFSGDYPDLTNRIHNNGDHSRDYSYSSTHSDVDVQIDEANGIINFVTN